MSASVSNFMAKPHKKYKCGRAAQSAKKTLMAAFCPASSKEVVQFESVLEAVMKTKKGVETLTALSKLGYSFAFEVGNFGGLCNPNKKKIVLNPNSSFEYLLETVVHEGRHAIQNSLENPNRPNFEETTVASDYRHRRAIEADAVAHQMAFVYQAKDIFPEVYRKAEKENSPMFRAFVDEMAAGGDERKAMQASFKAWYTDASYREFYDKAHKNGTKRVAGFAEEKNYAGAFSKEYTVEDVLKTCVYKGKPYIEPSFLTSGLPVAIKEFDQKEIMEITKRYAEKVPGAKLDNSVMTMPLRDFEGRLIQKTKTADTARAVFSAKREGR